MLFSCRPYDLAEGLLLQGAPEGGRKAKLDLEALPRDKVSLACLFCYASFAQTSRANIKETAINCANFPAD